MFGERKRTPPRRCSSKLNLMCDRSFSTTRRIYIVGMSRRCYCVVCRWAVRWYLQRFCSYLQCSFVNHGVLSSLGGHSYLWAAIVSTKDNNIIWRHYVCKLTGKNGCSRLENMEDLCIYKSARRIAEIGVEIRAKCWEPLELSEK